jgi:HlyD family secretion protein
VQTLLQATFMRSSGRAAVAAGRHRRVDAFAEGLSLYYRQSRVGVPGAGVGGRSRVLCNDEPPRSVQTIWMGPGPVPAACLVGAGEEGPAGASRRKDMRRVVWGVVGGAVVLAVAGFIVRHDGSTAESYRFVTIQRGNVAATVSATGTLEPVRTVQVGTQVSGQISALYADYNSHVKKGELVAQLDPTLLQQAVAQAEASAESAKADLDEKAFLLEQEKELFAAKTVTESDYRAAEHDWEVADASNKSAQAALDRARQNLRYANIYAPIDGVVIERNVDVGQTVAASFSAPQLFLIAKDLTHMQILAQVDESDIGQIRVGQPVSFTVQAYPDTTFDGTVSQVRLESKTEENVVDYTVVIDVSNADGRLLPGMTATVTFLVNEAKDVLEVPNAAIRFRPSQEMLAEVRRGRTPRGDSARARGAGTPGAAAPSNGIMLWYLDDAGELHATRAHTGITDGQVTEISGSGIHEGMQVVAGVVSASLAQSEEASPNPFQGNNQRGRFRPGF